MVRRRRGFGWTPGQTRSHPVRFRKEPRSPTRDGRRPCPLPRNVGAIGAASLTPPAGEGARASASRRSFSFCCDDFQAMRFAEPDGRDGLRIGPKTALPRGAILPSRSGSSFGDQDTRSGISDDGVEGGGGGPWGRFVVDGGSSRAPARAAETTGKNARGPAISRRASQFIRSSDHQKVRRTRRVVMSAFSSLTPLMAAALAV